MSESDSYNPLQKLVLTLIRWYQRYWSPDHSPRKDLYPQGYCRYSPSCSEYGYQAIAKYGVIRGGVMALWRVIRCTPWSRGGNDPVK